MCGRSEKEAELTCLSRPTLQQLAKQHDVKANLKTIDLIQSLLEHFPCLVHSPECLLVLSLSDDSPSPPSSPSSPIPSQLPPPPSTSSPPPYPSLSISSHDLKARRKTWHKADIHIGDRLLSPTRFPIPPSSPPSRRQSIRASIGVVGVGGEGEREEEVGRERAEFERVHTQPLIFSAVQEGEEGEEDREEVERSTEEVGETSPPVAAVQSPPFVGFISARRGGGRQSTRSMTRMSSRLSTRRQTLAPPAPPTTPLACPLYRLHPIFHLHSPPSPSLLLHPSPCQTSPSLASPLRRRRFPR